MIKQVLVYCGIILFLLGGFMSNYQERVIVEREELNSKLSGLDAFIQMDSYDELDTNNQQLLSDQQEVMAKYSTILGKRIELF